MSKYVAVITGASSGFGALSARAISKAGHIVYAGMRGTVGKNANEVKAVRQFALAEKVDLRSVEMDVQSQVSVDKAIEPDQGGNRSPGCPDPQRRAHELRTFGGVYSRAACRALRHQCTKHAAGKPCGAPHHAQARERTRRLGW